MDIHNDFRKYPKLYTSIEDVLEFIDEHKVHVPVLSNLLKLLELDELDLTPTESWVYFDSFFGYIYDVFRVPCNETYQSFKDHLQYLESLLVFNGLQAVKDDYYSSRRFAARYIHRSKNKTPPLNYIKKLKVNDPDYYINKDLPESKQFWIRTSRCCQPVVIENEAFMRVHVHPHKVYIFGCDDCSYTFEPTGFLCGRELDEFVKYLKYASSVWCFSKFKEYINSNLEFTN